MLTHQPVLTAEVIKALNLSADKNVIDATVGGGGHAQAILKVTSPNGQLLGLDVDRQALRIAAETLRPAFDQTRYKLIYDNYLNIDKYKYVFRPNKINAVLLDLGLSSIQLQAGDRGFSFQGEGAALDMRFDAADDSMPTAEEIVNTWPIGELAKIFRDYGEERLAGPIAEKIGATRKKEHIKTTSQLAEIINSVYRAKLRSSKTIPWIGGKHPATKTFQALRLAVNNELKRVAEVLPKAINVLASGGRLAVISFHSLEDRIVKNFFRQAEKDCDCPPLAPVCRCEKRPLVRRVTKRAIKATTEEIAANPRARSARLRVIEKI